MFTRGSALAGPFCFINHDNRSMKYHLILAHLLLISLSSAAISDAAVEHAIKAIELSPPLNNRMIEASGLTWCGSKLLVLPQYPERFNEEGKKSLYSISKNSILAYLAATNPAPLQATRIELHENAIRSRMASFDGYEAIACQGDTVWLSIEAQDQSGVFQTYVVPAEFDHIEKNLSIRTDQIRYVKSQSRMVNMADEAITLTKSHLITLHEVNDKRRVDKPKANRVNVLTGEQDQLEFEHLPFRITDATAINDANKFWVINYQYSGDEFARDSHDFIAKEYGQGKSHQQYFNTERLIEYKLLEQKIVRTKRAPIQLMMEQDEGRNWEGITRLENTGFLLITDKHPETILGFVEIDLNEK